jgi:hypothetical protein
MDGDRSSSDLRVSRAGVAAQRGGAKDGQRGCCRHREEGRATRGEGEQEVAGGAMHGGGSKAQSLQLYKIGFE